MNQKVSWSEFDSVTSDPVAHEGSWEGLVSHVKRTKAPNKKACPLLKLSEFGNNRNGGLLLRNNANVTILTGVEGDYDAGVMPIEQAASLVEKAGIKAMFYTTPSNGSGNHRWRVLCPTSEKRLPEERRALVGRLNAVLGQVLAPESFTLSQAYYFGDVGTNDYKVLNTEGEFIDKMSHLDEIASKPVINHATPAVNHALDDVLSDIESALSFIPSDDRDVWLRVAHGLKTLGPAGWSIFDEWSSKSDKYDPVDAGRVWASLNPTSTSYKAVFAEAQRRGWINPASKVGPQLLDLESAIVPLDSLSEQDDAPQPHIIEPWIPEDEVTLLSGHGGGGKSYEALSMGIHVACGKTFADMPTKQSSVLFFSAEDGKQVLRRRVKKICRALGVNMESLKGKLHLLDASDIDAALHRGGYQNAPTETPLLDHLAALVQKLNVGFVIVDNASDTYDDDEIKRARVRRFVKSLRSRIARPGRAVLLLAHINKTSARSNKREDEEDYSGSTAWHNSVRSRLSLIPDKDRFKISHVKANYGAKAAPVSFEWVDGVPLVLGKHTSPDIDAIEQANKKKRDSEDKRTLIAIIDQFTQRGEFVNTAMQGGYSAYKTLKQDSGFPKVLDADRCNRLLRELQDEKLIVRTVIKTADRKEKSVFKSAPNPSLAASKGSENA